MEMSKPPRASDQESDVMRRLIYAEKLVPTLLTFLSLSPGFRIAYATTNRIKSEDRIHEKIIQRRGNGKKEDANYNIERVTDIIGFRFITLYRADIVDLVEQILLSIKHQNGVNPNPFERNRIREFKIYTTGPRTATKGITYRLKALAGREFPQMEAEVIEKEDYSSVHIIAELRGAKDPFSLPIELQVRSVFEDTWGQIDHRLRYSKTRESPDGGGFGEKEQEPPLPGLTDLHLATLKSLLDACADHADTIRRQVQDAEAEAGAKSAADASSPISTSDLDFEGYVVEMLKGENVPPSLLEEIGEVLQEKERADKQHSAGFTTELAQSYNALAERLHAIFERESRPGGILAQSTNARTYAQYFLRMEEAVCLLLTGNASETNSAVDIYKELEPAYDQVVAVKFRLAQAYSNLNRHKQSIGYYESCKKAMDAVRDLPSDKRQMELPDHQLAHIEDVIDRLHGYEHWSLANEMANSDARLEQLKIAYELTYVACHAPKTKNRETSHNNCLFFAIDALQCATAIKKEEGVKFLLDRITEHMNALTAGRQIDEIFDPFVVHTLAYACDFLGDGVNARAAAKRTMRLLAGMIEPPIVTAGGAVATPNVLRTSHYSAEKSAAMNKSALMIEDRWDPGAAMPRRSKKGNPTTRKTAD